MPTVHGYMVTQDGRAIQRGLTYAQASRTADDHARGYLDHRDTDKRRVPAFEVQPDTERLAEMNATYRAYKQGDRITWQDRS